MKKKVRRKYVAPLIIMVSVPTECHLLVVSPKAGSNTDVKPFDPSHSGSGGVVEPDDED